MSRLIAAILVLAALGTGCASSGGRASSAPPTSLTPSPSGSSVQSSSDISALFDVGNGRQLHLECIGKGSPTIVIDVGNDDTIRGSWGDVFSPMAAVSRVCGYDRANTGQSDPAPGPRLISDLAADLVALLHVAKVPGPYVFVGGSFGGNLVSVLAAKHPELVAGIVFVDSVPANEDPDLDPLRINLSAQQYADCCGDPSKSGVPSWDAPDNTEHVDFAAGLPIELASVHALPRVPTSVITATRQDCEAGWPCDAIAASVAALEAQWIAGNPAGTQVLVDSGHVMQREAPQSIIEETRKIVELIRSTA